MCTDFESCVNFVLPHNPVSKKRGTTREAIVSDLTSNPKPETGRTGVKLRWYKYPEFQKISKVQNDELRL